HPCCSGSNDRGAIPTIRSMRSSAWSSGISPNPKVPVGPVTATVRPSSDIRGLEPEAFLDHHRDRARLDLGDGGGVGSLFGERQVSAPVAQRLARAVGPLRGDY